MTTNNETSSRAGQAVAARGSGAATETPSATMTMTNAQPTDAGSDQVLRLTLRNHPGVRWDESVVDNEGMGRKSSKRCCIFHKQRAFDESSTDSSDEEDDDGAKSTGRRRIARPKKKDDIPDFQRFHA